MKDDLIELFIMNQSFETLGVVDNYTSMIWHRSYSGVGDFEIYIMAGLDTADLLVKDFYVYREDDEEIGIIEDIKITHDIEEGDYLIVTGRFVESILDRRIIWEQTTLSGTAENAIRNLINANVINPTNVNRKIDNIILANSKGFSNTIDSQVSYENLLSYIEEVCLNNDFGMKTTFDKEIKKFVFEIYKGIDKSYNQMDNPWVVFSDENDNLLNSEYSETNSKYKNTAKSLGEGEGIERKSVVINDENIGMNRRELYVDARDISSNNGEIVATEYNKLLMQRGLEKLSEHSITKAYVGEVDFQSYVYKKDWNLGDVVTIENKEWGIYINSRITDIIESYSEDEGYILTPTFAE